MSASVSVPPTPSVPLDCYGMPTSANAYVCSTCCAPMDRTGMLTYAGALEDVDYHPYVLKDRSGIPLIADVLEEEGVELWGTAPLESSGTPPIADALEE